MTRARASHFSLRVALAASFVLATVVPVSAVSPGVVVSTPTTSPKQVTVGFPVAYTVTITNNTNNTLRTVRVTGLTSPVNLTYLGAAPDGRCDDGAPLCDFSGLAVGASAEATFYFLAPSTPMTLTFTARANFDSQTTSSPAQYQNSVSAPVETEVMKVVPDLAIGHAFGGREITTSLGNLDRNNKHGTTVRLPGTNAEVRVEDLGPGDQRAACTNLKEGTSTVTLPCFGEASLLSVTGGGIVSGGIVPGGIEVTMRWDSSDLPKGMSEKKLRIVHLLEDGSFERVVTACTYANGVPTNIPCISVAPFRLADKDIQATFFLASNRVTRGY